MKRKAVKSTAPKTARAKKAGSAGKAASVKSAGKRRPSAAPAPKRAAKDLRAASRRAGKPAAAARTPLKSTTGNTRKETSLPKPKQAGMRAVKEALLKRREFLRRNFAKLAASAGFVSEKPVGDRADDAALDLEVESVYSIAEHEAEELRLIDAALEKVANGTYGICEECRGAIEKPRLKALPYAVLCLKCKQAEEVQRVDKTAVDYSQIEEE